MEQAPDKTDIVNIFKRLRAIPSNKVCFDCGAKNPTWASVTYGVFICMDCSAVHRSLGVHLSFVRSTQLDTNWTWLQLRAMQVGGNAKAKEFFQQHNHTTTEAQQKYNSRVANLYREKLHHLATSAMRIHGTKPIIDTNQEQISHDSKDIDFFQEHTSIEPEAANGNLSFDKASLNEHSSPPGPEPTVDHVANAHGGEVPKTELKSHSILAKTSKKVLGGKKGLGAQRIATDFKVIEKEAENLQALKEKTTLESAKKNEAISKEEESKKLASMRLAYQDLSLEQKKAENKLKGINPQKAEQMERLGMGFASNPPTSITHSAMSDMKIIHQSNPQKQTIKNKDFALDDDFEFLGFSLGPPKYGDSPFSSYGVDEDTNDNFAPKKPWDKNSINKSKISSPLEKGETPRKKIYSSPSTSNEAQKQFGNAKSISSSQFFGNNQESDIERRANLTKFESSKSISSAEFFGKPTTPESNVPNFYDIKEGVKGGVTKVAGRLSNLASGVITSIQDRYGY